MRQASAIWVLTHLSLPSAHPNSCAQVESACPVRERWLPDTAEAITLQGQFPAYP